MNILSLFDGISCGRVALQRAGIDVENYYASELDTHAIRVSQKNWPDIVQIGDVCGVRVADLPFVPDLIIGGSPCQGFSFSGKQLNFNDPRSALFFEYVRILEEARAINPNVKFILENVKMKAEYLDAISERLGVNPRFFNSEKCSAQSRPRYYWFNWDVDEIQDMGIVLKDILVDDWEEKHLCSPNHLKRLAESTDVPKRFSVIDPQKAICMTARQFANWRGTYVTTPKGIRKLTPVECERLQNLPDNYTAGIPDGQRYKALGNGWTVDVVAHILKGIKNDTTK